jgi:regulator of cell morphogenesis and NO signaling
MLDPQLTVANVVLDHSECAAVFQRHRIDFCCRGHLSVEAACAERKLDTAAVLKDLEGAIASRREAPSDDPRELSTAALVQRIVSTHHEYLRRAMPFVGALAQKVARVHGDHNPKLRTLNECVGSLIGELGPHLDSEEQSLFPALTAAQPDVARAKAELGTMHQEHLAVGALLEQIRVATEDFSLPDWACNSYRTLFAELAQMEADILRHVHLENHVLMPRFAN